MSTDNNDFVDCTEDELGEVIKFITGYWKAKRQFEKDLEEIVNEPSKEDPK